MDVELFQARLKDMNDSVELINTIEESISTNSAPHRQLAKGIDISYQKLRGIYKANELKLLVDYYTFCEQLMKEFIYSVLEFHATDINIHRKKFLNDKLKPATFSPRVMYKEIEGNLNKYLDISEKNKKIKLLSFGIGKEILKKHDELVLARHTYAHKGEEPSFSILEYVKSNILLLSFLLNDFQNINICFDIRLEFQEKILQLSKDKEKLQRLDDKAMNWKERFNNVRKSASDTHRLLGQLERNSDIYNSLEEQLKEFQKIDLRRNLVSNKSIIKRIDLKLSKND
ncbi:hypothetical protein ACVRWQ_00745 [Streptococcus phocae subsp. salmonis]|uniref:hypothetical protein n=1 Tax=Streptococcus phocae TaxID=119224 RepID=UPI0005314510|nr:hypothetical protein [Streptococcus phocae]KGR73399.1 hypothetical protein NX86_00600 [Streptococcus phocae subsp. salmonis]